MNKIRIERGNFGEYHKTNKLKTKFLAEKSNFNAIEGVKQIDNDIITKNDIL